MMNGWAALALAMPRLRRIYLGGPPGIGKTYAATHARNAKEGAVNGDTTSVTLNEDIVVQELLGHYIPEGAVFKWHDGPIAKAVREGSLLVINEIQRASGAVQDMLLGVLDDPDVAVLTLPTGEKLKPHADFAVVATSNSGPEVMDEALRDRFDCLLWADGPSPHLVSYLDGLPKCKGLGGVVKDSYKDPERAISPRRALTYAQLWNDGKITQEQAAELAFGTRAKDVLVLIKARVGA